MPTQAQYDHRQALIARDLACRQIARLTRFQARSDLSAAAVALASEERATLLQKIAELDRTLATPRRPFAAAVLDPAARLRLRQAGANLAEARAELASDRARSNAAARHRTEELAETSRIRELAELNALPTEELREACPSYFTDLPMVEG